MSNAQQITQDAAVQQIDSRSRHARRAVATIFFTNGTVLASWIARIPDVRQTLHLSEGHLGIALGCMAVGALLSQIATGWQLPRRGSRTITTTLALLFCVTVSLPGVATSFALLMLALLLLGAANGGLDVAMNAQAAQVEEQYGRPIMASFHGLWSLGGLVGAALGGLAAAWSMPVAVHFCIVAVVGFVVMFDASKHLLPDPIAAAPVGPLIALPSRTLLPLGAIAFGALVCEGAVADWSAVYLHDTLGTSSGTAAMGYAVFALAMAGGRLSGDWLTSQLGPALIVCGGGMLIAAGMGLVLVSSSGGMAMASFGLIGAGVACLFPVVLSAAAQTSGAAPGTAIAAIATAGYSGFLLGPPLLGALAEQVTLRGALGLVAVVGVGISIVGTRIRWPKPA